MTTTMFHSAAGWYGGGGREKKVWVDGGEGGLGGVSRKIINAQTLCKVPKRHPAHKAIFYEKRTLFGIIYPFPYY